MWEEVPEKGKCLVPYLAPPVTAQDVSRRRSYYNSNDRKLQIITSYTPEGKRFCTVMMEGGNYTYSGRVSRYKEQDLADYINSRTAPASDINFDHWA